jgi:polynucleotide kinase-phosphatase
MKLSIPELSLVLLIGPSGAGKSTFARRHFLATEVLSSDAYRGLVSGNENDQDATKDAFEVLRFVAAKRLARGLLTVIDATNTQPEARKPLVELAREYHVLPVAVVLDVPEKLCHERNRERPDRQFGAHVVRNQLQQLHRSLRGLEREGFRHVHVLRPEGLEAVEFERQPLWNNRKHEAGPFDIIGDIHGCLDELVALLSRLGYAVSRREDGPGFDVRPPEGRKAVFLGDLVDRGPDIPGVLRLVMGMVEAGTALCVPGNHEIKLMRKLRGKDVKVTHGLAQSLEQLEREPEEFRTKVVGFIDGLVSHYVLDGGRLVVAHAGLKASMQGRGSGKVRDFCLYGETTGETDEYGLPVRHDWASEYRGKAMVVYGHTPVPEAEWLNNTLCLDTGCVYGGKLTALRYPERELVSVPAARVYCEPVKPLGGAPAPDGLSAQQLHDDVLDLEDVLGKRLVSTRLMQNITLREENTTAALEVMSRFALHPRWLVYLPPTMSPPETSREPGLLEHPAEAFAYFQREGVEKVICEEKHMGSRAVVVVCRDAEAARRRFGATGGETGVCYTRTGRRFFNDAALEAAFLERLQAALGRAGFWEEHRTDWACLDCELMPWSLKAQELLREQYAAVGAAARASLSDAVGALAQARSRGVELSGLPERFESKAEGVARYTSAWRSYCWPVKSLDDVRLAPFHLLATEGAVHVDKDHVWHMEALAKVCRADERLLVATSYRVVELADAKAVEEGTRWWEALTSRGGEGMVVKPLAFLARGKKGLVQPAVKCRGPDYLRIIYGPEYTLPENLERLRQRGLSTKRALALRELALGVESLERFVRGEPLRRVHECAFGVLALESEPVDPRL